MQGGFRGKHLKTHMPHTDNKEEPHIICAVAAPDLRRRLKGLLKSEPVVLDFESDLDKVAQRVERAPFDAVITDHVNGPRHSGALKDLLDQNPETHVLFLGDEPNVQVDSSILPPRLCRTARRSLPDKKLGALLKRLVNDLMYAKGGPTKARPPHLEEFGDMVGRSEAMRRVYGQIRQAAATELPVLLTGETGTGKDLAAEAVHRLSSFSNGPYVPVHLGAFPPDLVAGELFGSEKGAFTGAEQKRVGRFEEARGGTIFLDEIGTLPQQIQVLLLRVLEKKAFRRLGGQQAIQTNARVVSATNENLEEMVETGGFRQDLYYRLDVLNITIPPLRERPGDIPLLVDYFLKRYNEEFGKNVTGIAPECIPLLDSYDWPGNVRELKNIVQRAVLVCAENVISPEHLPPRFRTADSSPSEVTFEVGTPLQEVEREMVARTLAAVHNNRTRAAEVLGISRRALYNKLQKYGL